MIGIDDHDKLTIRLFQRVVDFACLCAGDPTAVQMCDTEPAAQICKRRIVTAIEQV